MTIEFQNCLLKFLFQDKDAKKYKDYLDQSVFDVPVWQLIFGLWKEYVNKYNNIPSKSSFIEYTDRAAKCSKGAVTAEVYTELLNTIAVVYTPNGNEYEFTKDVIIEYARRKGVRNLFSSKADKIKLATVEDLDNIYTELRRIVSIGAEAKDEDKNRGGFLFRDGNSQVQNNLSDGHPTFLHGLNRMTAARGFYSPQLILLMGGPKAFKTGLILSILIEYARSGLNVFIADAENGVNSIRTRIKQNLLECERHEVSQYGADLKNILKRIKSYGGDIVPHFFPAYISTLDHVDAELERLAIKEEWVPNIIFYDYLQLFSSSNKKILNKQDQIQDVYHHAIRLNNKWNTFAFTAIKVKREAVSKLVLKADDIGVDFGQAYNCHATFALCRTELESQEGNARIVPVLQREGTVHKYNSSTTCAIRINEATQTVTELDAEAYMLVLEDEYKSKNKLTTRRRVIATDKLTDE